jgi:hypothetical protein
VLPGQTNSVRVYSNRKPKESTKHFQVTPVEPYAVCCVEGLKVSCAMHRFGLSRFPGTWDDYFEYKGRHNNRLLGDFRKSIKISSIIKCMSRKISEEEHWKQKSIIHGKDSEQAAMVTNRLLELSMRSTRRERVQCRLFEVSTLGLCSAEA